MNDVLYSPVGSQIQLLVLLLSEFEVLLPNCVVLVVANTNSVKSVSRSKSCGTV